MGKIVEVDEGEYNQMVALRAVAGKIVAKPESRRLLEQAQKLVDPNAATPMLDEEARMAAPVNAMKSELAAEIAALKKERDDEKRESTLAVIAGKQSAGLARLRRAGYTDEGVAAVQKLMEDKGLLDVEDAVAIFERSNPPQMPATPSGGMTGTAWGFADTTTNSDKDIEALIGSKGDGPVAEAAAMRMANQALVELRGRR